MNEARIRRPNNDFFLGFWGSDFFLRRPTALLLEPSPEELLLRDCDLLSAFSFAFFLARLFCAGVFLLEGILSHERWMFLIFIAYYSGGQRPVYLKMRIVPHDSFLMGRCIFIAA